jgi:hypothetical protein
VLVSILSPKLGPQHVGPYLTHDHHVSITLLEFTIISKSDDVKSISCVLGLIHVKNQMSNIPNVEALNHPIYVVDVEDNTHHHQHTREL